MPTAEQEQRRALSRQRDQLRGQRLSVASQGRSLVLTQGLAISNHWWKSRAWPIYQKQLAPWLIERLEVFRQVILAIDGQIDQLDQRLPGQPAGAPRPAQPQYAGTLSLNKVEAEVLDWRKGWQLYRIDRGHQRLRPAA